MQQVESMQWQEILSDDRLQLAPELLEACRAVRLRLGGPSLTSIGITSALHGEGRTTIAAALAMIEATDYRRGVILVETDMNHPSFAERLGLTTHPGLSELALEMCSVAAAIQPLIPRLSVITAGVARPDASATILERLRAGLLDEIQGQGEVVILDLPPALASSYGSRAAALCEQLIMVVRAGITAQSQVREAMDSLTPRPALLLNGVHSSIPRWLRTIVGR